MRKMAVIWSASFDQIQRATLARHLAEQRRLLIGAEFKFLRQELHLSREAVAALLSVKVRDVARWEKAYERPMANKAAEAAIRLIYLRTRASGD